MDGDDAQIDKPITQKGKLRVNGSWLKKIYFWFDLYCKDGVACRSTRCHCKGLLPRAVSGLSQRTARTIFLKNYFCWKHYGQLFAWSTCLTQNVPCCLRWGVGWDLWSGNGPSGEAVFTLASIVGALLLARQFHSEPKLMMALTVVIDSTPSFKLKFTFAKIISSIVAFFEE